jgi:hypothetical protein
MPIAVTCAQCRKQFQAGDELAGRMCRCPCGATLQVPARRTQPATQTVSNEIVCSCPGCHRQHRVGQNMAGKQARCTCGTIVTVPMPQVPSKSSDDRFADLGDLNNWTQPAAPMPQSSVI